MSMLDRPTLAFRVVRLLAAAGAVLLFACSHQPRTATAAQPAGPAAKPAAAVPAATPSAPGPATLEPPDGKWLADDQGRKYFLTKMDKVEGWYRWLNPEKTRVQLQYGLTFDVASYDDHSFEVKIYKVDDTSGPAARPALTAAEKEKIAASYRTATGSVDRLTLEPFGRGLPARGQWRNGFKIVDIDGDGHPDIVNGPSRKGNGPPVIFLGDGQGGWHRWTEVRFPDLPYDYGDVAVADLNGDGRLDLALAMHLRGLVALVADGPASFKNWSKGLDLQVAGQAGSDASGFSSRTLEAADWNGDGRPDLISMGEGPRMGGSGPSGPRLGASTAFGLVIYFNQGDGSWVRKDELQDNVRLFGEDLAVADFTNDGHLDIVLGTSVLGEKSILRIGGASGSWSRAVLEGLRPLSYVGAVDVADFNGDHRADLVIGYLSREGDQWRTGIDLYLGRAGGRWDRRGVVAEDNRRWITALDSGDLDGDGKLDLAATTGDGGILILLGKGDGTFDLERTDEVPQVDGGCRGYDIRIVNLDADPAGELVAEFAGEPSAMFAPAECVSQGAILAWKAKPKAGKK